MKPLGLFGIALCVLLLGVLGRFSATPPRRTNINDHTVQGKGGTIVLDGVRYHTFFARGVDGNHVDIEVIKVEKETP